MSVALSLQAQDDKHPIVASHDIVDGPMGGQHNVEDLRVYADGKVTYTVQASGFKSSSESYQEILSVGKVRNLVQILSLSDIRNLPETISSKTRPVDFFWDKSLQIDRPERLQRVHIENFYPFLNLNSLVYPQALIELECALQDIKSTAAKRSKGQGDWCEELVGRNASPQSSYECSKDETQTRIAAGSGWGAVHLGASFKAVEKVLGEGQQSERFSDVHFVEFRRRGIEISFNNSDDTVHAIYFYNGQRGSEQFGSFCGQTDTGINWNSRIDDVKKAYGHPSADFLTGDSGRLVFTGVDFRFESGRLVRIGIPGR